MPNPAYPLLNSKRLSWASISVNAAGGAQAGSVPRKGFTKLSYKVSVERSEARGHGRYPLGHTEGDVSYEGSISFLAEEADAWLDEIGANPLDQPGTLTLNYKAQGSPTVRTITLQYSGMKEYGGDDAQGPNALERTFPLDVLMITRDGQPLTTPEGS